MNSGNNVPVGWDDTSDIEFISDEERAAQAARADAPEVWQPQMPAPVSAPDAIAITHGALGTAAARWVYRDEGGRCNFMVVRFNEADGTKQILPYTYGFRSWTTTSGPNAGRRHDLTGWHFKSPPRPLPLYGLDRLASKLTATVVVVEGEKAADAAADLFPEAVCMTSQGGSAAARKSNWSPLQGRDVVIWPDHDKAGANYATDVAKLLSDVGAASVRVVQVPVNWPEGWDLADTLPPGADADCLGTLIREASSAFQDQPTGITFPQGFMMDKEGLWFSDSANKKSGKSGEAIWVCAPFRVLGEAADGNGGGWSIVVEWQDRGQQRHVLPIPHRLLHAHGHEVAAQLADAGLNIDVDDRSRLRLKKCLAGLRSERHLLLLKHGGWHDIGGKPAFLLPPNQAFGPGAENVFCQADGFTGGRAGDFCSAGLLAEWNASIGRLCVRNSRLILAVCAALDGPLLDIIAEQSGGVHIMGKSQSGKSTTAFIAGSVWGRGDRTGQVRSWRGTSNGLEGVAAKASDTLLVLDEMGQADAKDVGDTVYMLANGAGKSRATRHGGAREAAQWRLTILSTGELGLAAKMGEAGKRQTAGLAVRLLEIPADAGVGMGVFEDLHDASSPGDLADRLRDEARTTYGTLGPAFVECIVRERGADPEGLRSRINEKIEEFCNLYLPDGADGQTRTAVRRFARMASAGEMAINFGILDWPAGEAAVAISRICDDWLIARGGTGPQEDRAAYERVVGFIEAHGSSRFEMLPDDEQPDDDSQFQPLPQRTINRAGWRVEEGEVTEYWVLPLAWRDEICKGIDPGHAAAVMAEAGKLIDAKPGRPATRRTVPGHGRIRVYVLRDVLAGDGK